MTASLRLIGSVPAVLVALLVSGACSTSTAGGARDGSAETPPADSNETGSGPPVDASALAGAAVYTSVAGDVVGYFGWAEYPIDVVGDTPLAAYVGVCTPADSAGQSGAFGVTAGGAELLNPNFEADLTPQLIPMWRWPEPGECNIGWRVMPVRAGVEPTTLVWRNLIDSDDETSWPLGSPVDPPTLGLGETLSPGTTAETADGHRLTILSAEPVPDAAGETVPADAWYNAGAGYDPPPSGALWWAVDHEYCFAPGEPATRVGTRNAAIEGWFLAAPVGSMNAAPGFLAAKPADPDDECERRFDFVAVPEGSTLTHFRWETDDRVAVWELG